MNVRIRYDTSFVAGVHWQDQIYMTNYGVDVQLLTNTIDPAEQNIAMYRMKSMISDCFTSSVFINQSQQKQIKQYLAAGIAVTTLPEDPLDQIVGIMLYCKLNAVMEGRLLITNLDLSSEMGDSIVYSHSDDEVMGPLGEMGWWHSPDPIHNDLAKYYNKRPSDERIVEMQKAKNWKDYGFHWNAQEETPVESSVVYADFPRKP